MDKNLKLVAFDLDKTLVESKTNITPEMGEHLVELMKNFQVAIISGGNYIQFVKQVLNLLPEEYKQHKANLHLLPTSGTKYYDLKEEEPREVYAENLSEEEKEATIREFERLIKEEGIDKLEAWGERIEDRGTQFTLSVLGQQAPVEEKMKWDPSGEKKNHLRDVISPRLPDTLQVNTGGSTSIDIVRKGRDKGYGMEKLLKLLGIDKSETLFVGDNLKVGGNDYPVKEVGIECIETSGPNETIEIIEDILKKYRIN